jgi:hypothetical protein
MPTCHQHTGTNHETTPAPSSYILLESSNPHLLICTISSAAILVKVLASTGLDWRDGPTAMAALQPKKDQNCGERAG